MMHSQLNTCGDALVVKLWAPANVGVTIRRAAVGQPWSIEGNIALPEKNSFMHLRDVRIYLKHLPGGEYYNRAHQSLT
jgi:hypothetical protein